MYRILTFFALVILGLVAFFARDAIWSIAGYKPIAELGIEGLDEASAFDERAAPRFFADRNRLELEVPHDMTVGELLRLYQIDFPHVRRQIAAHKGVESVSDSDTLAAGERLELTLTPPAEGQP